MSLLNPKGGDYGYDDFMKGTGVGDNIRVIKADEVCNLSSNVDAREKDKICQTMCEEKRLSYHNVYEDGCGDKMQRFNCMCVYDGSRSS